MTNYCYRKAYSIFTTIFRNTHTRQFHLTTNAKVTLAVIIVPCISICINSKQLSFHDYTLIIRDAREHKGQGTTIVLKCSMTNTRYKGQL